MRGPYSPIKKRGEGGNYSTRNNMVETPKHCFMEKKLDAIYFIYVKFKNRQINL